MTDKRTERAALVICPYYCEDGCGLPEQTLCIGKQKAMRALAAVAEYDRERAPELAIEQAVGGAYQLPDGRKFWVDTAAAREIARRVTALLSAQAAEIERIREAVSDFIACHFGDDIPPERLARQAETRAALFAALGEEGA
jgi:hypothetical protein